MKWSIDCSCMGRSRPTSAKKGRGVTGTSHVLLHCTVQVQLHYSILSCGTLHHLLSKNNGLKNGDRELGHLFCYYRNCKNNSTIRFLESVHTLQQVRFHVCIIWNLVTSSDCIPVAYIHSSPAFIVEVGLACETSGGDDIYNCHVFNITANHIGVYR